MKAPIGEKAIAEAEEIEGYHVISLRTKEVTAGETNDTVLFTYRKDKVKKENLFRKACAVLAALFLIYWGVMYGRIEAESQAGRDRKALELMDYTPFYRLVCQDKYEKTEIRVLRAEGTLYEYYISINDGKTHTVSFQAPSDGEYIFMSTGSDDTVGYLYRDAAGSLLIDQNDDSGLSRGNNFGMTHTMKKDETVYVGVRYLASSRKGTIHLLIFRKR